MYSSSFHVTEHTLPTSHIREYPRATANDQEEILHLAIKQYTPRDEAESSSAGQPVTLIGAHANGFPKELYEPLWEDLLVRLKAKGIRISSIWIADVAQQGASGVLNEASLGNDPSWMDHPRDLFLMVNHFRTHMRRPIIGIGHSMGGNNLVNLAIMHPRLFISLVLIDPVIQRGTNSTDSFTPAQMSSKRRDHWPSRSAARAAFLKSKFYQAWDSRVLDNWIEHGLRDVSSNLATDSDSGSGVTLTTSKTQEVFTFLRPNYSPPDQLNYDTHADMDVESPPYPRLYRPEAKATFLKLPHLRPSVLYIFGAESYLSLPVGRAEKMAQTGIGVGGSGGVKKGRVAEVLLENVGHLIPMEKVDETASAITSWIVPELDTWRRLENVERTEWAKVPKDQKNKFDNQYVEALMGNREKKTHGVRNRSNI